MEVARKDDLAGNVISRQSPTKFSLLSVKAILGMRGAVLYFSVAHVCHYQMETELSRVHILKSKIDRIEIRFFFARTLLTIHIQCSIIY